MVGGYILYLHFSRFSLSIPPHAVPSSLTTPTTCMDQPAAVSIAVDSKHPSLSPNLQPAS